MLFPFIFLVVLVSMLIMGYVSYYMLGEMNLQSYSILMLIFIVSMVALLMSNSFILMLLSWEGLGVSSFFLIYFYNSWEAQANSLITTMTMRLGEYFLFMWLSGLLLVNNMNLHSYYYSSVMYMVFVVFTMTKSAIIPFSGWLPKAMSAPTPTSALVHSSTLVTAGLIVMMAFSEMLNLHLMMLVLLVGGAFTLLMGSVLSLMESSIKKMVAFSTLSQMGLACVVFGLGNFHVGLMNLVSHGLAKSLLFMQVGVMMHNMINQQNTRLWNMSNSVESLMKVQFLCTLFSLCGTMFFGGMVTKESLLELVVSSSLLGLLLLGLMFCVYTTFMYSIILYKTLFNNSQSVVVSYSSSITLIIVTYLEVFMVISYSTWMSMNVISKTPSFITMELMIPLVFLFFFVVGFSFIGNGSLVFKGLNSFMMNVSSYQLYKWLSMFIPTKFVEAFLNMMNTVIYTVVLVISRKMYFSISLNHVGAFLFVFLLFFL